MPEAEEVDTRIPSVVVVGLPPFSSANTGGDVTVYVRRQPDERELLLACQAVMVRSESMALLGSAVAELSPNDPRHDASYAVMDLIRPDWVVQMDHVAAISARGAKGFMAKASLIVSLVERDDADRVQGTPTLCIARSLAQDLIALSTG